MTISHSHDARRIATESRSITLTMPFQAPMVATVGSLHERYRRQWLYRGSEVTMDLDDPTPLELTRAEALVLFEWLHRMEAEGRTICENRAEQIALWNLSSRLESILV